MGEAASASMQTEEAGEEGLGMGRSREEVCGGLPGTSEGGAGTVTGAGVGLRLQPHGTMGLMTEPAFNRNGRATDGSGSTFVSRCASARSRRARQATFFSDVRCAAWYFEVAGKEIKSGG
jgi:hypothetical protein